jgi:hypothetical protein
MSFSEPLSLICKMRMILILLSRTVVKIQEDHAESRQREESTKKYNYDVFYTL